MALFVSSTERPTFTNHLPPHTLSTLPERFGCDVLWSVQRDGQAEWWGVQRKELKDFIASVLDGRLAKEIGQMKQTAFPLVMIEGEVRFTSEGILIWNQWGQEVTRQQWMGMQWSLQRQGVAVQMTRTARDTAMAIASLMSWSAKDRHSSMTRRPSAVGTWGTPTNREFGEHLLMGLPGVGPDLASRIYEQFGRVPWTWTVTEKELQSVKGIGKGKARQMIDALPSLSNGGITEGTTDGNAA